MKKLLVLTFAFWVGLSNFAYSSARDYCADMKASSEHACCDKEHIPCQCSIEAPSDNRLVPVFQSAVQEPHLLFLGAAAQTQPIFENLDVTIPEFHLSSHSPPLYALYSAYRI